MVSLFRGRYENRQEQLTQHETRNDHNAMLRSQPDRHPCLFALKLDAFWRIADTIAGWMLSKDENHLKLRPDHVEIGPHARLAGIHFGDFVPAAVGRVCSCAARTTAPPRSPSRSCSGLRV